MTVERDVAGSVAGGLSEDQMYERLVSAVLQHRLLPGTKLVEDKLAGVFGVSRTRVRPVLVRLANEHLVTLIPNRGAFVAQPSPQEAQEVFEARRLIEPTLVARCLQHASDADLHALRDLIEAEEQARERGEVSQAIRLSGEFHLRIAEVAGQATLGRILRELVSRTSLILMTYGPAASPTAAPAASCRCHEHRALVAAMRLRAVPDAQRLMREHLQRIESGLVFAPEAEPVQDLAEVLDV